MDMRVLAQAQTHGPFDALVHELAAAAQDALVETGQPMGLGALQTAAQALLTQKGLPPDQECVDLMIVAALAWQDWARVQSVWTSRPGPAPLSGLQTA
jgi:hypothetical protein